jgi:hypothetical protein
MLLASRASQCEGHILLTQTGGVAYTAGVRGGFRVDTYGSGFFPLIFADRSFCLPVCSNLSQFQHLQSLSAVMV